MVEVTQEDREAAAMIYQQFRDYDYARWIIDGTNAMGDHDSVIQAFAVHRIAAEKRGIERAAKAIEADALTCDCHAREEGECACGAWCEWKSITSARAVDIIRALGD